MASLSTALAVVLLGLACASRNSHWVIRPTHGTLRFYTLWVGVGLVCAHELKRRCGRRSLLLANQAVAFAKMSRSVAPGAVGDAKRTSSSRSALLSLLCQTVGCPGRMSCAIQLAMLWADGPNSRDSCWRSACSRQFDDLLSKLHRIRWLGLGHLDSFFHNGKVSAKRGSFSHLCTLWRISRTTKGSVNYSPLPPIQLSPDYFALHG